MGSNPLAGRRVVVVDDDAAQASTLATLLRLEGIVATYEDVATSALATLLVDPPDVLVIDVKMPGLSGTELLAKLRARYPSLPAVLLTGYEARDPRLGSVMDSGGVAYLAKPVELHDVLEALAKLLGEAPVTATVGAPALST